MTRDETRFSPNVGSLYAFVETSGWTVNATNCSYYVSGGITSSYNWSFTGYSQLQWWENGTWHDLASEQSGTYSGYGDKVYDSMYDYFNRQYADRLVRVGNYAHAYVNGQSTSATAYIEYIVPALPPNATTVTATRNSNTSVTLSWTEASGVKESVRIERSIDGSSFAEIATVSGSATSYTDNTTAADHTYTYRIRYYNQNAYGGYSSTSSVTMSPSAPTKITVARATSTNVNVTLTNPSSVATSIQWQVTYDGGSTWSSSTSVSGSPVRSFTASTNGGTVKIRVRNVNATGSSAWIVSDSVVTLVPPAPPTAIEQSGIVNLAYGRLNFNWKHNPLDGSPQTSAILHCEIGSGISEHLISSASDEYYVDVSGYAPGTTFSWKVKTKGADPSYSDWSDTLSGRLLAKPQVWFAAQNPPAVVTSMPISIQLGFNDPQHVACASAVMTVKRDGKTVYTEPLTIDGMRLEGQITAAELLPLNGETYTVSVTARSGTTLEATTNTTFTVDYIEPTHGTLQVQNEPETGYASLLASFDNHASDRSYSGNTNSAITVDGAAIRSMTVDGKSVQDGTPSPSASVPIQVVGGANIFNAQGFLVITSGNGAKSIATDGTITAVNQSSDPRATNYASSDFKFTLPAGTYRVAIYTDVAVTSSARSFILYRSDNILMQNYGSDLSSVGVYQHTFAISAQTDIGLLTKLYNGAIRVMIYQDANVQPYIPYGSIGLKVSGKNRLDTPYATSLPYTHRGVTYSDNGDGGIAVAGTATGGDSFVSLMQYNSANNNLTVGETYTLSTHSDTVKARVYSAGGGTTTDASVIYTVASESWQFLLCVQNGNTANTVVYPQIERGSTATDYTPYVDSLTEIPLAGYVLASLPDGTKDVLTVDASGHVTIAKRISSETVNSNTGWTNNGTGTRGGVSCIGWVRGFAGKANGSHNNMINGEALCSSFVPMNTGTSASPNQYAQRSANNKIEVFIPAADVADLTALGTLFAAHPATFYYKLATPQAIDLGYITMPELADGCTVEVLTSLSTPLSMVSYDGLADAESISVIRVNKDGSRTQLADHAANYTAIVDKYAPLNTAYVYEVVTYAASGAYAVEVTPNLLESTRWFAYWGENNIAWAQWNPSGSYTLARPEKKRVHYAGRKWPVSYDSKAMDQEHSMTWTVVDMDNWRNGFVDLMNDGGRGVYKGCDGWVFHADFDYSATPQYTSITRMGDMSLTISRIDGAQL